MATTTTTKTQTTRTTKAPDNKVPRGNQVFLFDKSNYTWMLAGVFLILLGIVLTAGGKSADPHQFNYDEIYSFRRITLAPLLMMIGFGIEIYAIMKKPAETKEVKE
jgi:uncharacterized membrane protein